MKYLRAKDRYSHAKPADQKQESRGRSWHAKPDLRKPLTENTTLHGYRIRKFIGRGSFSLVYKAVEMSTMLNVVIKEYFPKHYAGRRENGEVVSIGGKNALAFNEGLNQFHNEALALKHLKHPNVLNASGFFRANETAYLVTVDNNGRDLKWFLSTARQPLDQDMLYKVIMPILSALNFLHEKQLLHLDVKPANILLQPNGKSLLLDFGAARFINNGSRFINKQVLTHGFAPPELYDKNRQIGPWTDVYSTAATLYFSICIKIPASSKNCKIAPRLSIDRYGANYHLTLLRAINRALKFEPSERFDSADEFALALLEGSKWINLLDYEVDVMAYNRFDSSIKHAEEELISFAA
ncbi:MAG: serine/threonine protein kinase [Proteobacteria bacterium]|nr:serine/threonine protein kinase [Pseudomonadota bacterium]